MCYNRLWPPFYKGFLQNLVTWPQRNLNAELAESRFLFLLSFFFLSFVYNAIRHLQYIHYLGWEFHPVYLLIVQKDKKKRKKMRQIDFRPQRLAARLLGKFQNLRHIKDNCWKVRLLFRISKHVKSQHCVSFQIVARKIRRFLLEAFL